MEQKHVNEIREIIYRLRQGIGMREISRELCLSRNTVRKYRDMAKKGELLDMSKELPSNEVLSELLGPCPNPRHKRSTVEPYEEVVKVLLAAGVEMAAIWQRLRDEHGYRGSYSSVRRYVARVRPKGKECVCRVESKPGEEAQVDFGSAGLQWDVKRGEKRRAWAFVMTLCWSRHQYVEIVFDQKVETWLCCHERAFEWFGGVPGKVVIDNLKAAVIKASFADPVLGEPYRRLAQHYGFVISPNRPRTPEHKGKVESGVHYVKRNFLAGREFADLESMNSRVRQWCLEIAGEREHGTTKESPLSRFEQTGQAALQALPERRFDMAASYKAKVHRDCHVTVDGRYYSVPSEWVGEEVDVYVGRRVVEIYKGTELLCTHERVAERGGRVTRTEHYPEQKRAFFENPPERCCERAEGIGNSCGKVVSELLKDRVQDRLASVHALLRLAKQVGEERMESACTRALHYGDPSYRRIKTILKASMEKAPLPGVLEKAPTAGSYQYARDAECFFREEVGGC